jgi:hypothetical protein
MVSFFFYGRVNEHRCSCRSFRSLIMEVGCWKNEAPRSRWATRQRRKLFNAQDAHVNTYAPYAHHHAHYSQYSHQEMTGSRNSRGETLAC